MKLKTLPPTLRDNRRYLALEIISQKALKREDLISMIGDACLKFHGECETSKFRLWLTRSWEISSRDNNNHFYNYKGILQCRRGQEEKVRGALCLLTNYNGKRIVFHTRGVAGTILSLTKKFIKPVPNIDK